MNIKSAYFSDLFASTAYTYNALYINLIHK